MMGCVFCEIVAGREPADVVYDDEHAVAFMDIEPLSPGHVLVVPRAHCRDLFDVSEDEAAALMVGAVRVAGLIRRALHCDGMNLRHATGAVAGQDVFHLHLHLIPRYAGAAPLLHRDAGASDSRRIGLAERRAIATKIRAAGAE